MLFMVNLLLFYQRFFFFYNRQISKLKTTDRFFKFDYFGLFFIYQSHSKTVFSSLLMIVMLLLPLNGIDMFKLFEGNTFFFVLNIFFLPTSRPTSK